MKYHLVCSQEDDLSQGMMLHFELSSFSHFLSFEPLQHKRNGIASPSLAASRKPLLFYLVISFYTGVRVLSAFSTIPKSVLPGLKSLLLERFTFFLLIYKMTVTVGFITWYIHVYKVCACSIKCAYVYTCTLIHEFSYNSYRIRTRRPNTSLATVACSSCSKPGE